jgi:hypothetical protein
MSLESIEQISNAAYSIDRFASALILIVEKRLWTNLDDDDLRGIEEIAESIRQKSGDLVDAVETQ